MDEQSVFAATNVFRSIAPERIVSGADSIEQLPRLLQKMGADRILIATSNSVMTKTPNVTRLQGLLGASVVSVFPRCREHSPEQDIFELVDRLRETGATAVVSIGGSSVFDTVKVALSRLADAQGAPPHPQIAIPTTLSAGEFTPGAGYTAAASGEKALVLDLRVSPRLVILDPTVTQDTPESLWFGSAIKAIDHAMEAVWSRTPHPYVDALALEAIRLFFTYLPRSRDRDDLEARAACQIAAWMSISGVGASGMRLSHFLGHQIGARMHIPHGVTSCILLPAVMRHLRPQTLAAQVRIATAMGVSTGGRDSAEVAAEAADQLQALIVGLGLPTTISAAGGKIEDIEAVASASMSAAEHLGLTADLPRGIADVRAILMSTWE